MGQILAARWFTLYFLRLKTFIRHNITANFGGLTLIVLVSNILCKLDCVSRTYYGPHQDRKFIGAVIMDHDNIDSVLT